MYLHTMHIGLLFFAAILIGLSYGLTIAAQIFALFCRIVLGFVFKAFEIQSISLFPLKVKGKVLL